MLQAVGLRAAAPTVTAGEWPDTGWSIFLVHGQPLLLGAVLMATVAGGAGYWLTQAVWRRRVLAKRAARQAARRRVDGADTVTCAL